MEQHKKAYLILEDGTIFEGKSFGAEQDCVGEVVFNTGMTGYQEILSDPSYYGQIVTLTYPLIGNYGINRDDFESLDPKVTGLIVKEHCLVPNHWRQEMTIDELLKEKNIPGIYGIDTRKLTRLIRQHGTMKGTLVTGDMINQEQALAKLKQTELPRDQVARVSTKNPFHCPGRDFRVVVIDYGSKTGIVRELANRHCDIRVLPHDSTAHQVLQLKPDGVLLTNGPGNPEDVPEAIETVKELLGKVPIFGICLGHQLLALACGAKTEKMVFGHRGSNHPVLNLETNMTMMTSQNHGFTVCHDSVKNTRLEVTHIAVNDGSVEGLKHLDVPAFSVQYHPEASPGPEETEYLFDDFMNLMDQHMKKQQQLKKEVTSYAKA